jgi:signal transduction histidine kinase
MMLLPFSCAITLAGLLAGRRGLLATATLSVGGVSGIAVLARSAPQLVGFAPLQGDTTLLTVGTFGLVTGVLATMVYQFGRTLTATLQRAEAANRLKDDFLAIISHELRTPMTAILGYGQLLQKRPRDAAYTARTLEKMLQSARAQMQIIEDLLDRSQIMAGSLRLTLAPIDVAEVVAAAITVVHPAITAKALRLATTIHPGDTRLYGDTQRLQQVVWNLLTNAMKFTPPGGSITVSVIPESGLVRLLVRDTGQGISPTFLPYIFDDFRQGEHALTRSVGGLGLGLALVRHLVTLHGGTVQAASAGVGRGTTITITLPQGTTPFDPMAMWRTTTAPALDR